MIYKKILSTTLAAALCLTTAVPAFADSGSQVFTDVPDGSWYHDAVYWAVENNITNGISNNKFAPDMTCTRAQAVTFLWNMAGKPSSYTDSNSIYVDVDNSAWYANAVNWALNNGVTDGTASSTVGNKTLIWFSPDKTCTRAEIATLIWNMAGKPDEYKNSNRVYMDVDNSAWYANAVNWTLDNGITNGTASSTAGDQTSIWFSPNSPCTRSQIVTMLCAAKDVLNSNTTPADDPSGQARAAREEYTKAVTAYGGNVWEGTICVLSELETAQLQLAVGEMTQEDYDFCASELAAIPEDLERNAILLFNEPQFTSAYEVGCEEPTNKVVRMVALADATEYGDYNDWEKYDGMHIAIRVPSADESWYPSDLNAPINDPCISIPVEGNLIAAY